MNIRRMLVIGIVLIVVLNLAGLIGLYCKVGAITDELNTVEYSLFVGLNDKDTYKQEISDDDAIAVVRKILAKHVSGYTIQNALGAWMDENGKETNENTIICYISDVAEETIHGIADDLIEELNQSSVLIQKNLTRSEYYEGK